MLRGFVLRPKHLSMRAVGEVALSNTGPTRNASSYEECLAMMQGATEQPSAIMRLPKEVPRKGHDRATLILRRPAGASKDGGCGLKAGVRGGCFEGAARHLSMRTVGVAASCSKTDEADRAAISLRHGSNEDRAYHHLTGVNLPAACSIA